jgi:D-amino-acid dehydrogenase
LHRRGLKVCLVDRETGPAQMTSAANAGVIAPGFVSPFASPGTPSKVLVNLFARDRAFSWSPAATLAQWRWLGLWLGQCSAQRFQANRAAMLALARYSQQVLQEQARALGIGYRSTDRYWVLFRTAGDWSRARSLRTSLERFGLLVDACDGKAWLQREPALARAQHAPHAALRVEGDEAGDCRVFVRSLLNSKEARGIDLRYGVEVNRIEAPGVRAMAEGLPSRKGSDPGEGVRVELAHGESIRARHCVVSSGPWSAALLRHFLPRVPLYPVRGFSLTWRLESAEQLTAAFMDEHYKIALTPLPPANSGESMDPAHPVYRLRAAGMAHLGASDPSRAVHPARLREAVETLWRVASSWLGPLVAPMADADVPRAPSAATRRSATSGQLEPEVWSGARPMLPDGLPLIGPVGPEGLWVNAGHGSTGWAMAAGSAELLAAMLVGGERLPIDPLPYQPSRWR